MTYDVVVVGAGVGGLTVAALLAARGVNVCVLERQSQVGGCLARVEIQGQEFDPGMGLYTSWGTEEIHQKVFSQLPVDAPQSSLIETDFVVRLPDGRDVRLQRKRDLFLDELRRSFPECAEAAAEFYQQVERAAANRDDEPIQKAETIFDYLAGTSDYFKSFIDAQLRSTIHTSIEQCAYMPAAVALSSFRSDHYVIQGGPATLAERLADSIRISGGRVRLDTPVLRLAYDKSGAVGVDLLSGETVHARRAVVSNMTIWDTYGKLIGLNRTPSEIKKNLAQLNGSGAYLIYALMNEAPLARLPSERLLIAVPWPRQDSDDTGGNEISFAAWSHHTENSPSGKIAVTIKTSTPVTPWFSFQSSLEDYEEWDQAALESVWQQLHAAMPELGGDIEVVETANPRTFYDQVRRKLGMVCGVAQTPEALTLLSQRTTLPNVFMVGDTVAASPNLASITTSALALADFLTERKP